MLNAEVRYRKTCHGSLTSVTVIRARRRGAMTHKDVSLFRHCRRSTCPLRRVCGAVSAVRPPREGSAQPHDRTLYYILVRSVMTVGTVAARPLGAAARLPARDAARQRHRVDVRSTDRSIDRSIAERSGAERGDRPPRRSRFGDERSSPRLNPRNTVHGRSPHEEERNATQCNVTRCVM